MTNIASSPNHNVEDEFPEDSDGEEHWKFVWPSADVIASFIYINREVFKDTVVVELGAGATGVTGLAAAAAGAKVVYFTEYPKNEEAFEILESNVVHNIKMLGLDTECKIMGLNWLRAQNPKPNSPGDVATFLNQLVQCDYIVASDVFYDEHLYPALVKTISLFVKKFPKLRTYFAYQIRDESDFIEDLLALEGLTSVLIRRAEKQHHTFQLGVIYKREESETMMFAGIEGGATQSHLVFVDINGKQVAESRTEGLNMCLDGYQTTADSIASWVRKQAKEHKIELPFKSLGMGLSGAEDDTLNEIFTNYLYNHHGDLAEHFSLNSDAICVIQAAFAKCGTVMIVGTGSSTRLLKADGTVHGVGGWGHMIGDGGSGFWLSRRAIQVLFDDDDGLEMAIGDTSVLRKVILEHFGLKYKENILPLLYSEFNKSKIASLCKKLAENADDSVISKVFYDTGYILGRQMAALSRHMDAEMLQNVHILTIGSVFKSWHLCNTGFIDALKNSKIIRVSFCKMVECPAVGAAILAAKETKCILPLSREAQVYKEYVVS